MSLDNPEEVAPREDHYAQRPNMTALAILLLGNIVIFAGSGLDRLVKDKQIDLSFVFRDIQYRELTPAEHLVVLTPIMVGFLIFCLGMWGLRNWLGSIFQTNSAQG